MLVDGRGVPLSLVVTGANRHDVSQLESVLDSVMVKYDARPQGESRYCCCVLKIDNRQEVVRAEN